MSNEYQESQISWIKKRPFKGSLLLFLSGLIILFIPISMIPVALMPGSFSILGIVFGGLVVLLGILGFTFPDQSSIIGVLAIFFACLSLIGALGGFLIGTLLGIIGGAYCFAWKAPANPDPAPRKQRKVS
ncbi:DUF6114 domain-containing protein [Pullulanibacillus sp. KACC 23026]|uniref:DUF6114 domain-containing protein n=1 Tax=Pullulanibacillus sp. KACC 23026 TaxID=3028315 RepID=UPI0023B0B36C|nr:DUF6114 domain-containing protein [Pullulanibacillus sp. KACC 23026]WEG14826.1 DUF6114 domain-containing protein [Pullulanibacillus sp. KACC 23026]